MTLARDGGLVPMTRAPLATRYGTFTLHRFTDGPPGTQPLAITCGDVTSHAPLRARVHSPCITSEGLGACDCDCREQLDAALRAIARCGRGAVFYLMQEGRGSGLAAKALDRMLVQSSAHRMTTFEAYACLGLPPDERHYDDVATMMRGIGIGSRLRLLSNNPTKIAAVREEGIVVEAAEPLAIRSSPYNRHYLAAKADGGHTIDALANLDLAPLPEPVPLRRPQRLATAPDLIRVAAYLIPLRRHATVWLWLHLYLDSVNRHLRIVLTYGDGTGGPVQVRLQRETLLDHLHLRVPRFRREWDHALTRIVAHGSGIVAHGSGIVVIADDDEFPRTRIVAALIDAHLNGRQGMPLEFPADGPGDVALLRNILRRVQSRRHG